MSTIEKDIIDPISKSQEDLNNWNQSLQNAHNNLSGKIQSIQGAEMSLASEITKLNGDMNTLNQLIASENTLIAVGGGLVGGAVIWGVMQDKINSQYKQIAEDRKEISQDQQLLVSLKVLETATSGAVSCMEQALNAMDGVKIMWKSYYDIIDRTVRNLDSAEKETTGIRQYTYTGKRKCGGI